MEKLLDSIGLTSGESKTYLALLDLGLSTVSPISKKADVSLSKVYSILDKLIKKGLVTSITKNNTKYFNAASPERIIDYLEEKKKDISEKEEEIKKILPKLKNKITNTEKPIAEVYEGVKGIKTFFDNILRETKKGDIIYALGIPREVSENYMGFFRKDWNRRRIKLKVRNIVLYNFDARSIGAKSSKANFINVKYLPKDLQTPSWIQIYNDVVATVYMGEENPVCVVIRDENISKSYRSHFNFLWKVSKR